MPSVDHVVESKILDSSRAVKLRALFDVPPAEIARREWRFNVPIDERDWNVGLIVGPSGAGKTQILSQLFDVPKPNEWSSGVSVIDGFSKDLSVEKIAEICSAVGFNTIPAWLRPYGVLSNGERFRVDLARTLSTATSDRPIVVDEFTSVVDRQVGKIASNAAQKFARRRGLQFVAATCHFDIVDWLQPDWIIEPANESFAWRSVQPRPQIEADIKRVDYSTWKTFAPYHYLTASLHRAARCYAIIVDGQPIAFAGVLRRPTKNKVYGVSRLVTLPDWQGIGAAMILVEHLGAAYRSFGAKLNTYPAHFNLIRSFARSPSWKMVKKPGVAHHAKFTETKNNSMGMRPCAVFSFVGAPMDEEKALRLIGKRP